MNNKECFEREISIKEIWKYLMMRIKFVCIISLAFILLTLVLGYYLKKQEMPLEEIVEEDSISLTEEEQSEIDEWLLLKNDLKNVREQIYNTDIIMTMPTEVYTCAIQYNIECEKEYKFGMLYSTYINEYCISNMIRDNALVHASGDGTSLIVEIISVDDKEMDSLKQEINNILKDYKQDLEASCCPHSLVKLSEENMQGISENLMQIQNNLLQNLQLKEVQANYIKSKFSDSQNLYLEELEKDQSEEKEQLEEPVEENDESVSNMIIVALFVGLVTFILGLMFLVWHYLTSGRIFVSTEIQKSFGIYHFGEFNNKDVLKKIDLKCQCDNIKKIGIVCDCVGESISQDNLDVASVWILDPENNVDELEKMTNIKNIVLKVNLGKTRREKLENIIIICEMYNINILGTVC